MTYQVIEIPEYSAELYEQLGTKRKFWYDDETKLFKEGRLGTGENWAEVVASRICDYLDMPHAHYDFGVFQGREGVVCGTIVPSGGRLVHANEPLARFSAAYNAERKYKQAAYTILAVVALLRALQMKVSLPPGWNNVPDGVDGPLGLFIGYLMLDALIANQDRHHENWGFIAQDSGAIYLAPTFDHASSLGRNESDNVRIERLTTRDSRRTVEYYATRGQSALYDGDASGSKRLATLEAFKRAAEKCPQAAQGWLERLALIDKGVLVLIFENIPTQLITQPAIDFAIELVLVNKKRLLDL